MGRGERAEVKQVEIKMGRVWLAPDVVGWARVRVWLFGFSLALCWMVLIPGAGASCLACHHGHSLQAGDPHVFLGTACSACHRGDEAAAEASVAHQNLVTRPGQMADIEQTCARCHAAETHAVQNGLMHTGRGMVNVTRFSLGEQAVPTGGDGDLARLGHSPADSLLRKRCASCHLGQRQQQLGTEHDLGRRGGGCLACHLMTKSQPGHGVLTAQVGDERCLGCHSRSGRIALSYAGLAEVDEEALQRPDTSELGYLPDGRLIERRPADRHHRAGLSCIDCHTVRDLMGPMDGVSHGRDAVDIQCQDCHANEQPRLRVDEWPAAFASLRKRVPFPVEPEQTFLVTARHQTPLWHIQVTATETLLHRKVHEGAVPIPQLSEQHDLANAHHRRLDCTACHTAWAPQCYGCHMNYKRDGEQWDHADQRMTPGAWVDRRWGIRNDQPPLGVDPQGRIVPFVPGMIRSIEHPDWETPQFRRLFAPLAPHTTGPGLTCPACHRSSTALGLGQGVLHETPTGWAFNPARPALADGLAEDAFVTLEGRQGETTRTGARGFLPEELRRILDAPLVHPDRR